MKDEKEFREWLSKNTTCSNDALSDIVCRFKRATRIQPWDDAETYLFYLEKKEEFQKLSMFVKSQIRRAVRLYCEFLKSREE